MRFTTGGSPRQREELRGRTRHERLWRISTITVRGKRNNAVVDWLTNEKALLGRTEQGF